MPMYHDVNEFREAAAAAAMEAIISCNNKAVPKIVAQDAVAYADALVEYLEKNPTKEKNHG